MPNRRLRSFRPCAWHLVQCPGLSGRLVVFQRAHDHRPDPHVVPPIAAFVAAGFEHCIANMYFIPMGLFIKAGAPDSFWTRSARRRRFPALTWENFFVGNLLPVTIGNIIGGSIMVGAVYWFVYLRQKRPLAPQA